LIAIRKISQPKKLSNKKKKLTWFPGKCFPFILDEKRFPEVMKNLKYHIIC
jgi:hypothetical protein